MASPTLLAAASPAAVAGTRELSLGPWRVPVILPSRRDPRLKVSAVIISLQVLGQTVLDFKLSIAQILVSIGVCAIIDMGVVWGRSHVLAWPASGLLTGNGVAFILRASGTQHGDWWSLNGIEYFVLAAVASMAIKHLVRPGGRHLFNPSNVGLVLTLLVIGPAHVFPQYLYWGLIGIPVGLALAVIALGAAWILRSIRMLPMALSFLATFVTLIAIFALAGRSFLAIWREGAISGVAYWVHICTSPELFIFVFFMMSDPQTAPKSPLGRVIYGAATAVVAAALIVFQTTEFGIKLASLAALTVVCALVPLIEWSARRIATRGEPARARAPRAPWSRLRTGARTPAVLAVAIIVVTAVAGTAAIARDEQVVAIERGLVGKRNAQ